MDRGRVIRFASVCTVLIVVAALLLRWFCGEEKKGATRRNVEPTVDAPGEVLSDEGFEDLARAPRTGTHVLFVAEWCPFCRVVSDVVRARTKERGSVPLDFRVYVADVRNVPRAVRRHDITQVPSLLSLEGDAPSPVSIPEAFQQRGW